MYDSNESKISSNADYIRQIGGATYYYPKGAVEFKPTEFSYKILAKRYNIYDSSKKYNLKIKCNDSAASKKLMNIFGEAPDNNICPSNIWVNNKDKSDIALTSNSSDIDFMFLLAGSTLPDYNSYIDSNVNVWMLIDFSSYYTGTNAILDTHTSDGTITDYTTLNKILNSEIGASSLVTFSNNTTTSQFVGYTAVKMFSDTLVPVIVLEKKNGAYLIISDISIIDTNETRINSNANLIYEMLMYTYLNNYISYIKNNEWITDVTPNYYEKNYKLYPFNQNRNKVLLSTIFPDETCSLVKFEIYNDNGVVEATSDQATVYFSKKSSYSDSVLPTSYTSIYSSNKCIVYYPNNIYKIEDS
jgi:hypothetical protein